MTPSTLQIRLTPATELVDVGATDNDVLVAKRFDDVVGSTPSVAECE